MSEREYKEKARNCFLQNTILINQNEGLKKQIKKQETREKIHLDRILTLQKTCGTLTDQVDKLKKQLEESQKVNNRLLEMLR